MKKVLSRFLVGVSKFYYDALIKVCSGQCHCKSMCKKQEEDEIYSILQCPD